MKVPSCSDRTVGVWRVGYLALEMMLLSSKIGPSQPAGFQGMATYILSGVTVKDCFGTVV